MLSFLLGGNVETWKPVVGYEGLYQVSDEGYVRSASHLVPHPKKGLRLVLGRPLSVHVGKRGRRSVGLCKDGVARTVTVASLVAEAFLGPRPEGQLVLHWDDDRSNDALTNLRYGTHVDNEEDKLRNGNTLRGVKHHKAKLTEEKALAIKCRVLSGETDYVGIAAEFGVSKETVQSIKHGRNWGWLECKLN